MRHLVTGGAGFLGSNLVDHLMIGGEDVICLDNFFTGRKENISQWISHPRFELIRHDVIEPILLECDRIWHLACPASPVQYQLNPIKTTKTSFLGTYNMLGLAKRVKARILVTSTSEIYGDPETSPQTEFYRGNVNTFGPRACYDEGKRIAETLCHDYHRVHKVDVRVARIFNTYGPRMLKDDGRVVSNFINQSLATQPITIYGDGKQTRSFCFVEDMINGLKALMDSTYERPLNIGNPEELTVEDLAKKIIEKINPALPFIKKELPIDDPRQRNPDIRAIKAMTGWEPKISLNEGLDKTIHYFKELDN